MCVPPDRREVGVQLRSPVASIRRRLPEASPALILRSMTVDTAPDDILIAFLDANIVLEGKPVAELPWEDLATEGVVRVLIVPKAMEEIDAKKRDGRLGPHARAFNRLIAPSVIQGVPVILRGAHPRVELQMASCSRIPWSDYDELDPDDGDSRIVAEALNVRDVVSARRLLVSHDIKPLAYARGRGLPVHQASDDWLRPPEPGPKDKEIQRLKQQVADLRKDEPTFEIEIDVSNSAPTSIYRVAPLDAEKTKALVANIRRRNPQKPNGRDDPYGMAFGSMSDRDSGYDGKYRTYSGKLIPEFAAQYHEKLELLFNQRLLTVRVTNAGKIRADHLVVSIETSDGWINDKLVAISPDGPAPPVPRPDYLRPIGFQHAMMQNLVPRRVGRHDIEMTLRARRSRETMASCEDFRSGQVYCFEGVVLPSTTDEPLTITVRITAKNLRGEESKTITIAKTITPVAADALVDLDSLETRQTYPTDEEFQRLLQEEAYQEIEWDVADED